MTDAERVQALSDAIMSSLEESHRLLEATVRREQDSMRQIRASRDACMGSLSALVDATTPIVDALWETGHPRVADVRILGEVMEDAKRTLRDATEGEGVP